MAEGKFGKSILSEDGTLNFDFMTSLQNIVIAKIINHLWMNRNIQKEIVNLCYSDIHPDLRDLSHAWQQIKNNVSSKVSDLPLPKSITNKLTCIVPLVGNSVIDWIWYHENILNIRGYSKYSAVDLISNIAWTARGKIDYAQTAKNILANNDTFLSYDHRYKLACTYCLEDEIVALAVNVVNEGYLDNVQFHIYPMVYFWTAYITGDNGKLYSRYRDYIWHNNITINEYIIQLLIEHHSMFNEVPIKYMWSKLNDEKKAKNIISFLQDLCMQVSQDLRYTLLSNLTYQQQQKVFKHYGFIILKDILNDWLWSDYFLPIALYILDIASFARPRDYFNILEELNKKMVKNFEIENYCIYNQYKFFLKKIWKEGPRHYKDFIFLREAMQKFLIFSLSWEQDMDIIELVFNDLNEQQKRDIIFDFDNIDHFSDFIINDKLYLLELFIKCIFSSEDDISQFKKIMLKYTGYKIAEHFFEHEAAFDKMEHFLRWASKSEEEIDEFRRSFIIFSPDKDISQFEKRILKYTGYKIVVNFFEHEAAFDKIEHFLRWASKSEEEIGEFRKSLAYIKPKVILKSFISNNKLDFAKLENHFKWCAQGDLEIINQFKSEAPKLYAEELISKLIEEDQYELSDQFLNWCFLDNQQKIAQYKCNMYKDDRSNSVRLLTYHLIKKDNSFELLNKFTHWCFSNEQEVQEFKTWLLYKDCNNFCTVLLKRKQLMVVEKFINWCCNCSEAVNVFKNAYMLSMKMGYIVSIDNSQDHLKLLIKLFNPSKETVQECKRNSNFKRNFYELLDKFIESQNHLIADGDEIAS